MFCMSELKALRDYQKYLVKSLAALKAVTLLKLSKELQRYGVITSEMMGTLASLDQERLDSRTTARYLLHKVCERVKADNSLCSKFLDVLGDVREGGVAHVSKAMVDSLMPEGSVVETSSSCSMTTEQLLLEEDVGTLWDVLIEGSYKWEEVSISLKLPKATIEQCKKASNNNLSLHEALSEWVCMNHRHATLPTLSHLKNALASPVVGLPNLVQKLDEACVGKLSFSIEHSSLTKEISQENSLVLCHKSVNTEVIDGMSTLLEVQVFPEELASYQWMKDSQPLTDSYGFSGINSAILLLEASQKTQGEYCCHMQCGINQLITSPIKVTVIFPPEKMALINLYSTMKEIPDDSWPIVNSMTFVDLTYKKRVKLNSDRELLKEKSHNTFQLESEIRYSEIFDEYQRKALILVEGCPGSGKTALAQKIAKDWAEGKILGKASKLFLIPLRRDNKRSELFYPFSLILSQNCLKQIEESGGDRVCFVLDGYDEYVQRDKQDSVINELIYKTYLPLAMVIVTSRPEAIPILRPRATCTIEILGFSKEQFDKFVSHYPFQRLTSADEGDSIEGELRSYLRDCTSLLDLCHLPLNANIVCFLYGHFRDKEIPKTETRIYDHFVRAMLLRKLRRSNPYFLLPISLKDLPEGVGQDFINLSSLAFNMTKDGTRTIQMMPEALKETPVCCLLSVDRVTTLSGLEDEFSFLHLVIQEYLAAYYLSNLNEDEQMEMIRSHSHKRHMLTTFKFYCGLVDLQQKREQFKLIAKQGPNMLYMFHCAFQAQEKMVCHRTVELIGGKIQHGMGILKPTDFNVLGYIMSNASDLVKQLHIGACVIYSDYNDAELLNREFDQTDLLSYHFVSTGAYANLKMWEDECCARFSYNVLTTRPFYKVSQTLKILTMDLFRWYNVVYRLTLCSSDIFALDCATPLLKALKKCHNLTQFSGICKSRKSAAILADILRNNANILVFGIFGEVGSSWGAVLARGLQNCRHLQALHLWFVELDDEGSAALAGAIANCKDIHTLELVKCNISSEGAQRIASVIPQLSVIRLDMSMNNIKSEGVIHFAQNIAKNPILTKLCLVGNGIDSGGVMVLAEKLSYCSNLQDLILSHNDVGREGAAALAHFLTSCINLQSLVLMNCNLTGCGILLLAKMLLNVVTGLTCINLSSNGTISLLQARAIADCLCVSDTLHELRLSNSGINCESAVALAEGLRHCFHLFVLDLSKNSIGSEGAIATIASSLTCEEMVFVDFSSNLIGEESVHSLSKFAVFTNLQKLDLSHNNIGTAGAKDLIKELDAFKLSMKLNLLSNNISSDDIDILVELHKDSSLQVLLRM